MSEQHKGVSPIAFVIEADPRVCEFAMTALSAVGFVTFAAPSSLAALRRSYKMNPDLLLVDMQLPNLQLDVIRSQSARPIVVGMSTLWGGVERFAVELGVDRVIAKPITARGLILTVEEAFGGRFTWIGSNSEQLSDRVMECSAAE